MPLWFGPPPPFGVLPLFSAKTEGELATALGINIREGELATALGINFREGKLADATFLSPLSFFLFLRSLELRWRHTGEVFEVFTK